MKRDREEAVTMLTGQDLCGICDVLTQTLLCLLPTFFVLNVQDKLPGGYGGGIGARRINEWVILRQSLDLYEELGKAHVRPVWKLIKVERPQMLMTVAAYVRLEPSGEAVRVCIVRLGGGVLERETGAPIFIQCGDLTEMLNEQPYVRSCRLHTTGS